MRAELERMTQSRTVAELTRWRNRVHRSEHRSEFHQEVPSTRIFAGDIFGSRRQSPKVDGRNSFEADRNLPFLSATCRRGAPSYFNKANGIGFAEVVYLPIEWRRGGRSTRRGGQNCELWWSRQYIVIHASSTLTTSVRFLAPAKTSPFLRAIAPVYEPAGICLSFRPSRQSW